MQQVAITLEENQQLEKTILLPGKLKLYGRVLFEDERPAVIYTPQGTVAADKNSLRNKTISYDGRFRKC